MLQMDFVFFNVESIRVFNLTFLYICSSSSHSFEFSSRIKCLPLDIPKFIATTLRNQYKKVSFMQVDEYGALEISYEFMRTCHNMNIIVKTTGGYASSLNGKIEIPNNKLANITIDILLNSSHKK